MLVSMLARMNAISAQNDAMYSMMSAQSELRSLAGASRPDYINFAGLSQRELHLQNQIENASLQYQLAKAAKNNTKK